MEKHHINIDNITDIKTLFHTGWVLSENYTDEFVLETTAFKTKPDILRLVFIILFEGIMNYSTKATHKQVDIDYEKIHISSVNNLAKELTRTTGIHFSI